MEGPAHLWMWKKCTDIYCEKYAKIWNLLKMYTRNVPFQISKYATGWGGGNTDVCPGRQIPSRRHCLYIVSRYTMRLMTPCVWRILYLRNSSSVPYFRQPPNLPTAARRNQKYTECGTTAFGRNWMSAESGKVPMCPHSVPKPKPKPKFGRPLILCIVIK